jgi:hypothetical protein
MAKRRLHSVEFKATVAVAAIRGGRALSAVASAYGAHRVHISQRKTSRASQWPPTLSSPGGEKQSPMGPGLMMGQGLPLTPVVMFLSRVPELPRPR